jgi:hypothetical protein
MVMMPNTRVFFSGGPQGRAVFRLIALGLLLLGGCTSTGPTTQPTDASERQDAILNDPMNYKPNMDRTVTGGDDNITHFGKGLNNDVDDFLNP